MKSTPFVYNYIEKKDLDEYLDNPINIEIFEDYRKDNNWGYSSQLSQNQREKALNYLNFVYYDYDFFLNYIDDYEKIQAGFITATVVRLKHVILLVEKNKIQLSEIGEKSLNFLKNHPDVNLSPSQAVEIFEFTMKCYDIISLPDTAEKLKKALSFKSKLKQKFIYNEYDIKDIIFDVDTEIEKLKELITLGLLVDTNTLTVDNKKSKPNQLQTKLTDIQRGKLYDLLVLHGFIPDTNKDGFIWTFGGEKDQPNNWQPIEWIDKSVTRKEPNIQTLFELLYLLGVDKDTSAKNPNNIYKKIGFCFNGLVNISNKNPYSIQQKTERQKLLKSIIEEVKKVEAQK